MLQEKNFNELRICDYKKRFPRMTFKKMRVTIFKWKTEEPLLRAAGFIQSTEYNVEQLKINLNNNTTQK